jgi:hypothetical protein
MRTKPARIEPGCPYCNADHDPGNLCRVIADVRQQEQPAPRPALQREVQRITDNHGKTIAVKHVYREG